MQRYQYSILTFNPDERRGERINIGLVVYRPSGIDVRLANNAAKVRALDPNFTLHDLHTMAESFRTLPIGETSAEDVQSFLMHMPTMRATEPGWFEVSASRSYERCVQDILMDIVISPKKRRTVKRLHGRLNTTLKKQFSRSGILGQTDLDIDRHLVVQQYPVSEASGLYADFAIKNGVLHLTETIDFRVSPDALRLSKFKASALMAITLEDAKNTFGAGVVSNVVYYAGIQTEKQLGRHLDLLGRHSDNIYNYASRDDAASYMDYMLIAAGHEPIVTKH